MLAQRIIPELESADEPTLAHDSSTNALIRRYRKLEERLVKEEVLDDDARGRAPRRGHHRR